MNQKMEENRRTEGNRRIEYGILTVISAIGILCFLYFMTGKWPFYPSVFNSYSLQAQAWKNGQLDLGQNYPHLELAIFQGKYYVSFPPFPSYILFPFTFFFGANTPDGILLFFINMITVTFLYKTGLLAGMKAAHAALGTLFVFVCSNALFNAIDPGVWFFAQSLCFMLSVLTIYFCLKGKGGTALFFWACAVGCRPMQLFFLPVILFLLWQKEKECGSFANIRKDGWKRCIPAGMIALSYMALNWARFGNIAEFGHNYLPEFVNSEKGQFSTAYFFNNLKMLLHFPNVTKEGRMIIDSFGNLSIFIVSPIILAALFCILVMIAGGKREEKRLGILIAATVLFYLIFIMLHKTMGGWHFGNRYANDVLPWLYLPVCMIMAKKPDFFKWQLPLMLLGFCMNIVGTCAVYNGWQ